MIKKTFPNTDLKWQNYGATPNSYGSKNYMTAYGNYYNNQRKSNQNAKPTVNSNAASGMSQLSTSSYGLDDNMNRQINQQKWNGIGSQLQNPYKFATIDTSLSSIYNQNPSTAIDAKLHSGNKPATNSVNNANVPTNVNNTTTTQSSKPTAKETIAQKWTRITGLPWSEAKKRGFTTGSYEDNIRIGKMLEQGYFDKGGANEVYWNNPQAGENGNASRMWAMMVPAYEAGMTPYEYAVQQANVNNSVTNLQPEMLIGDSSMMGNYDELDNSNYRYTLAD